MARIMTDRQESRLDYHATSFSQGRMDFSWEELTEEERRHVYADWESGKGLIGGDPRRRSGSTWLPDWGVDRFFFRTLALGDERGWNGKRLRAALATEQPLEIEIGFGRGDFILDRAIRNPGRLFIGYEVKTKAVRLGLARVERLQLENLWISDDDARFSLPRVIPDGQVDAFHVLFPDPWWKEQHRVRRLFSPPFVDLLAAKLHPGGLLHFRTDVQEYGELVRYLVEGHPAFGRHEPDLAGRVEPSVPTHREHWCLEHGLPVFRCYFSRRDE
jgi:tRNA (guanine-N7-)-methyltransferase